MSLTGEIARLINAPRRRADLHPRCGALDDFALSLREGRISFTVRLDGAAQRLSEKAGVPHHPFMMLLACEDGVQVEAGDGLQEPEEGIVAERRPET